MNWSSLPPLAALRAFAAYTETRSVNAAGGLLNVSHAAISQQMRALESHLGVALLDRSGRKLALTHEGETLGRNLIEAFGSITQTVEALTGAEVGQRYAVSARTGRRLIRQATEQGPTLALVSAGGES